MTYETGERVGVMVAGVLCEAVIEPCPTPGMVRVQYRKPDQPWSKSRSMTIHPERLRTPPATRVPLEDQSLEFQAAVAGMVETLLAPSRARKARQLELEVG